MSTIPKTNKIECKNLCFLLKWHRESANSSWISPIYFTINDSPISPSVMTPLAGCHVTSTRTKIRRPSHPYRKLNTHFDSSLSHCLDWGSKSRSSLPCFRPRLSDTQGHGVHRTMWWQTHLCRKHVPKTQHKQMSVHFRTNFVLKSHVWRKLEKLLIFFNCLLLFPK